MAKSKMGALVLYCGHKACFIADITRVGTANVVRASGPVTMENVNRLEHQEQSSGRSSIRRSPRTLRVGPVYTISALRR